MLQSETIQPAIEDGTDRTFGVMLCFHPDSDREAAFRAELTRALASLREARGCRGLMKLCSPSGHGREACVIVQFDSASDWQCFLESAEWSRWADRLSVLSGAPAVQEALGPVPCFVLPSSGNRGKPPPRAKTAVVMWVSVYPTITALLWLLWPVVQGLPLPVRTLILSVVMVPLMVWLIVPWVTARLAPWLAGSRG